MISAKMHFQAEATQLNNLNCIYSQATNKFQQIARELVVNTHDEELVSIILVGLRTAHIIGRIRVARFLTQCQRLKLGKKRKNAV